MTFFQNPGCIPYMWASVSRFVSCSFSFYPSIILLLAENPARLFLMKLLMMRMRRMRLLRMTKTRTRHMHTVVSSWLVQIYVRVRQCNTNIFKYFVIYEYFNWSTTNIFGYQNISLYQPKYILILIQFWQIYWCFLLDSCILHGHENYSIFMMQIFEHSKNPVIDIPIDSNFLE